jgi:Phosphatidylinositol-glycan biosynthesis class S protein
VSSTIRHEITLDQLVQSITDNKLLLSSVSSKHGHDDDVDDPFIAYFYISNLPEPLVVVADDYDHVDEDDKEHITDTSASRTVALSNRLIFRILDAAFIVHAQQHNNKNNDSSEGHRALLIQKEAALALDQVIDFMTQSCLGILGASTATTPAAPLWESDGSFPQFHQTLLFQRTVQDLYEKAVAAVQNQRNLVLSTSNRVPIREHHISVWQGAVDNIFKAIHLLKEMQPNVDEMKNQTRTSHESMMMIMRRRRKTKMMEVLDCLQQTIRLMEQMRANPDFIDRIDFPLEQYAAIFAPLALPLAIPLLVGLIREFKRYREKQRKKKSSSSSSSSLGATTTTTTPTAPLITNDTSSIKQD